MSLWILPALPLALGLSLWAAFPPRRALLAAAGGGGLAVLFALAATSDGTAALSWGAGVELTLAVEPRVALFLALVPLIAAPVVVWAAAHEELEALPRLVGLLVAFAGAMELLVLAGDLVTLAVGFELVTALSWALVGHRRSSEEATRAAVYAFNASRIGGLGLLAAAGASLAATGGFAFEDLSRVAASSWGSLFAAGVVVAAASKSAQVPFAPWLFRAMEGPSSASALLHSSTMVAAGGWILVRLHEPLSLVSWFAPVVLALGLGTACAGGVVALLQPHAKRLLAASTSAHYGLVFAAVGAGSADAGLSHLVTHAGFKALLFLAAGTALGAAGSAFLRDMRLGRALPWIAAASAVGALSLAGVPPLGGAWSKEKIVSATGEHATWLALVTMAAGALSAAYAARFQLLAYGREARREPLEERPGLLERGAILFLGAVTLLSSLLWLSPPEGKTWELVLSVALVILAIAGVVLLHRRAPLHGRESLASGWLGLPAALDAAVVRPSFALAAALSRFDDRVVDAGVRGAARVGRLSSRAVSSGVEGAVQAMVGALARGSRTAAAATATFDERVQSLVEALGRGAGIAAEASASADDRGIDRGAEAIALGAGGAGRGARTLQTGAIPTYYLMISGGAILLAAVAAFWR